MTAPDFEGLDEDGEEELRFGPGGRIEERTPEVPGYRIESCLGHGSSGTVYRARNRGGETVALKVLRYASRASDREVARFGREARIASRLSKHPGFIALLDFGDYPRGFYLTYEFAPHGSLAALAPRGKRMPARGACAIVLEVAESLGAAHAMGILHRDLKPENVLFPADRRPALADLGLARDAGSDRLRLTRNVAVGTFNYQAPEQLFKRPDEIGPATDVFALGVMLYELLVGAPPFGISLGEVYIGLEEGRVPPMEGIPAPARRLLASAMAVEASRRLPDAAAFARELAGLTGLSVPPRRPRTRGVSLRATEEFRVPEIEEE